MEQSPVVGKRRAESLTTDSLTTDDRRLLPTAPGTAKGTGFDRQFDVAQVAQVILVGYSSMKQEWRSRRVAGFPFWLFWP